MNYEGVLIDRCQGCEAVWLDKSEISRIINNVEMEFTFEQQIQAYSRKGEDEAVVNKVLGCPNCKSSLSKINYLINTGVVVDRCDSCLGVYLDNNELEKIQIFMEKEMIKKGTHPLQIARKGCLNDKKVCPRDGSFLEQVRYESQEVDSCNTCGGIWCDDEELVQIIEDRMQEFQSTLHSDIVADEASTRVSLELDLVDWLNCSQCRAPMERLNFGYNSGIIIDRCKAGHGVWLDFQEIERIQIFIERWEQGSSQIKAKYSAALNAVKTRAEANFDTSVQDGKDKSMRHTVFGKVFKSLK